MFYLVFHLLPSGSPADLIIRQCYLFVEVGYFFPLSANFLSSNSMIKFKD